MAMKTTLCVILGLAAGSVAAGDTLYAQAAHTTKTHTIKSAYHQGQAPDNQPIKLSRNFESKSDLEKASELKFLAEKTADDNLFDANYIYAGANYFQSRAMFAKDSALLTEKGIRIDLSNLIAQENDAMENNMKEERSQVAEFYINRATYYLNQEIIKQREILDTLRR